MSPSAQALLYLLAMVVTVPIAKRLGLGAVLGYLIAGAALGPSGLALLGGHGEGVLHLAEFGVIMMLFLIGLELQPSLLWRMRGPIFGLGTAQVLGTAVLAMGTLSIAGIPWKPGLAVGLIIALSSTAIVLQTLQEKGAMKSAGGEISFSVLLFQDVAVIFILALLPLLAGGSPSDAAASVSPGLRAAQTIGAVIAVIFGGRFLLRPVFRLIAESHLRELFTAIALLLVLATTMLMQSVGLSPALGAFLAGVVLADSEYRHQLEADIEPFKGLLLGVFFISVGAGIDFGLVAREPIQVATVVISLVALKFVVLYTIARAARFQAPDALLFAFSLAQGGEFAFVLINSARGTSLFSDTQASLLSASIALSMFLAPVLIHAYFRWVEPAFSRSSIKERDPDAIDERDNPVLMAGFGRFGQTIARLLRASGFKVTILDYDSEQVELLRKFGQKSFYGDASRIDLLHAAGADQARLLIIAIDDKAKCLEMVELAQKHFPHLKILARAYDRVHAYELIHRGVEDVYIETSGSALFLGIDALRKLGMRSKQAFDLGMRFRRRNEVSIRELAKLYHEADEATYVNQARGWIEQLEKMLQQDASSHGVVQERAWESAPRSRAQQTWEDSGGVNL